MSAIYVKLDASYHLDPKVLDLGDERAELLFIRGLTYCKTHLTDGIIHRRALATFAPFANEVPPVELAAALVGVGLWVEHPKGWQVSAWLDHHKPADEVMTPKKGREMAHRRHHVNKGIVNPECPLCQAEKPQVVTEKCQQAMPDDANRHCLQALPETETETETETSPLESQVYSQAKPAKSAPAVVDHETVLAKIVGRVTRAEAANDPAVASIEAILPSRRKALMAERGAEALERLRSGDDPGDVERWLADPLGGVLSPSTRSVPDPTARPALRPAAEAWAGDGPAAGDPRSMLTDARSALRPVR